ncbi:MAG: phosphatidylglycerophosphatase A [Zoogloeaceae bacterium]|jgi:phosphatidylglycerophosphatase A|nr:phosphatidylglycerophosphatase A [Rhodocyclaceae bacterium]MCP5232191.1 phosphatidylglycerophosphatase A [Zoogloeaceae bacterium]MCP5240588.1 phosphatidylglycerophosphatase A [Zoogloeaceae bacterium]MCP5253299.1 phosphatidylglycerophosphatase A [Zoogloeaceae bacterium]MCP5293558.1 phosphatidylglycerophosphatase A [Zoogloeaceae bacterium]
MRPTTAFLFAHPAHFVACGFGSGLVPKGPGTAGTLAAWLLYPLIRAPLSDAVFLAFLLAAFLFGIIAAERTGRALGVSDHGAIVWDEMVPFWLILMLTPPTLAWQGAAFVIFRFFDIVKPPPIRWADQRIKGGLGVMVDDVLAAGYTLLVLALAHRIIA